MTKRIKRILSLLLSAAIVVSSANVPLTVHAAEDDKGAFVDAFVVFADLHTDALDRTKSDLVTKLMQSAKDGIKYPVSTVNSAGDSFSVCKDSGNVYSDTLQNSDHQFGKDKGITAGINDSIYSVFGDSVQINYVWSDHDRYADVFYDHDTQQPYQEEKTSHFIYGAGPDGIYGNDNDDNYYLYALSMADLAGPDDRYNSNFNSSTARDITIKKFVDTAATLNEGKPLFIVSHQPLFERRDDNYYAENWCKAINEVAKTRDVGFFFGHNHSHDLVQDYFCGKDGNPDTSDSVRIETISKTGTDMTLNFSHVCAGYMAPGSNTVSDTTRNNTVLGVTIYENAIVYNSYDSIDIYKGSLGANQTVPRDFHPKVNYATYTNPSYDVSVKYEEGTVQDISVERISADEAEISEYLPITNEINFFTGYRISGAINTNNKKFEVTLPRTGAVLYNLPAVYRVCEDGSSVQKMPLNAINETYVSFTADTFGSYFIGIDRFPKTVYVPATSFEHGKEYLIVGEKGKGGPLVAYTNNNGVEGALEVVCKNDTTIPYSSHYIELTNENAVWTAIGDYSGGFLLDNDNYYISSNENNTLGFYSSGLPKASLNFDSSTNRLVATSGEKPYLYYSIHETEDGPEYWNWSDSIDSDSNSSRKMWIYEKTHVSTSATSADSTPAPEINYGGCTHAYASITTKATPEVCGYTIHTCVYCGHSDFGNFTSYVPPTTPDNTTQTESTDSSEHTEESEINPEQTKMASLDDISHTKVASYENNDKDSFDREDSVDDTPITYVNTIQTETYDDFSVQSVVPIAEAASHPTDYSENNDNNEATDAADNRLKQMRMPLQQMRQYRYDFLLSGSKRNLRRFLTENHSRIR